MVSIAEVEQDGWRGSALGGAGMGRKGVSAVAWQAQSHGSVADEAADPFHIPLRYLPLPHVVQQSCQYHSVKGTSHVKG